MKNKQRMTIRNGDGSVSQPMMLDWGEALNRLAEYEDRDEALMNMKLKVKLDEGAKMPTMAHKQIPCKSMFSNGTEYMVFVVDQCDGCTRFRNGRCRIFNACERARFEGEKVFPFDDLLEFEGIGGKVCKSFTTEPLKRKRKAKTDENQITFEETEEKD